jgi:hypothetical protein
MRPQTQLCRCFIEPIEEPPENKGGGKRHRRTWRDEIPAEMIEALRPWATVQGGSCSLPRSDRRSACSSRPPRKQSFSVTIRRQRLKPSVRTDNLEHPLPELFTTHIFWSSRTQTVRVTKHETETTFP